MDPIIGDFTLTSKTARNPPNADYENPAIISTTFPRAIKQNEGYEISLKSIAHAPVKNLVRSEFDLIVWSFKDITARSSSKTYYLPSRFYESQADLLMEIYRILGALDDPPSMILYEKDGETTLKFTDSHSIDIHSDIFLNRPFKYKRFEDSVMKTVSRKKRSLELDDDSTHKKRSITTSKLKLMDRVKKLEESEDRLKRLEETMETLDKIWTPMMGFYSTIDLNDITNAYRVWKTQSVALIKWQSDKIKHEKVLINNNEKIRDFEEKLDTLPSLVAIDKEEIKIELDRFNKKIRFFEEKLDTLPALVAKSSAIDKGRINIELDQLKSSITQVIVRANQLQEAYDLALDRLETKIDKNHRDMTTVVNVLTKQLGHDSSQLMATDTSNFVSTKDKAIVRAKEVTVSSNPIVTTRLGFLYCNVIENSLINNKESRLLCIFPIISKRGYSFYEVREAIYKPISVLQFSTITFTILDSEGDLVEFSLEGDQLTNKGDRKRKYPTLLNLHIRQRL